MIAFSSPGLVALLGGKPFEQLRLEDVEAAVSLGNLREDEDLELKRELGLKVDQAKAEFAKDVAALANGRGGLLIVGVEEAKGTGTALAPQSYSEDFVTQMRAAVASWAAPNVFFGVHFVQSKSDPLVGIYFVTVPRSPSAPHAVRRPDSTDFLRYPQRRGVKTEFLTESQVAAAYRGRFEAAQQQGQALAGLMDAGLARLNPEEAWLCIGLVPDARPERMQLDAATLRALEAWAGSVRGFFPSEGPFIGTSVYASPRAGRVALSLFPRNREKEKHAYAELHLNGSGFIAVSPFEGRHPDKGVQLLGLDLVRVTFGMLSLLAGHARERFGLVGDAACALRLQPRKANVGGHLLPMATQLGYMHQGVAFFEPFDEARTSTESHAGEYTLNLAALERAAERASAARILLTDIFAEFGKAEVPYIAPDGGLRLRYWQLPEDARRRLESWATESGVPTTDEVVG